MKICLYIQRYGRVLSKILATYNSSNYFKRGMLQPRTGKCPGSAAVWALDGGLVKSFWDFRRGHPTENGTWEYHGNNLYIYIYISIWWVWLAIYPSVYQATPGWDIEREGGTLDTKDYQTVLENKNIKHIPMLRVSMLRSEDSHDHWWTRCCSDSPGHMILTCMVCMKCWTHTIYMWFPYINVDK